MSHISESNEYTKFQLTKEETVSLMNFATAQCTTKLAHLASAKVEEVILVDDDEEDGNHSIRNEAASIGNEEADNVTDLMSQMCQMKLTILMSTRICLIAT
jgi:hypothetical protein